jgi:heat shock protein HslJ
MRFLSVLAALAMTAACTAEAQDPAGVDWQLLAIDGKVVDIPATLTIDSSGRVSGKAPCNSFTGHSTAALPDLKLGRVAATRMACDKLAEEQVFFDALTTMTRLERMSESALVLTGPDGRSMEFARGPISRQTPCTTCAP